MQTRMRALTSGEVDTFQRDGVVLVRDAVGPEWLDRLHRLVDSILTRPGEWVSDTGDRRRDGLGRSLDVRYLWRENADVRQFIFESGIARLVGQAMATRELRFYFDHWLVKEPGSGTETPWHQDVSYWPFRGAQIASMWLPLTKVDRGSSGLELVKGSHRWNKRYRPERFVETDETCDWIEEAPGDELPDVAKHRADYDILSEPMNPGDGLIFSAWTLHAATSNLSDRRRAAVSTRWLGDDATWFPHAAADPTVRQEDVSVEPGNLARDDDRFPLVWSST
jgi:ectoine hydroxylase-related dioxygenase (phytanoyl-CoA dioxygenase family)